LWKTEVGIERLEVRDVVDDQVGAVDDILHAAPRTVQRVAVHRDGNHAYLGKIVLKVV
jgi:hypothetical protein